VVSTSELGDPRSAKNAGDRCAWCKEALMDARLDGRRIPRAGPPGRQYRREEVVRAVKEAGFRFVTVDLEGFRSGSQNVLLTLGTAVSASVDSACLPNR
jgi:PP-loop superfamily ATP-utilizing enzyme